MCIVYLFVTWFRCGFWVYVLFVMLLLFLVFWFGFCVSYLVFEYHCNIAQKGVLYFISITLCGCSVLCRWAFMVVFCAGHDVIMFCILLVL